MALDLRERPAWHAPGSLARTGAIVSRVGRHCLTCGSCCASGSRLPGSLPGRVRTCDQQIFRSAALDNIVNLHMVRDADGETQVIKASRER
jgi:hypothetical protein